MPTKLEPKTGSRKQSRCVHHWVIEMASGSTSKGRCRHCESVRAFRNEQEPRKSPYQSAKMDRHD